MALVVQEDEVLVKAVQGLASTRWSQILVVAEKCSDGNIGVKE